MSTFSFLSPTSSVPSGKDFFELVKAIGESKSKQEEDRIIAEEVVYLKKAFANSQSLGKKKMKELVVRSLYVEMLGQDGSFAYLKIVELCASSNIIFKKVGYLAASLTFSPTHEFRLMLVNRMQQDMKSTNQIEACIALSGVCKLVTQDMVPAVFTDVSKLLEHDMDNVRKKAVGAIHRLYQLDPDCLIDHGNLVRRMICDKDPAVMAASLGLIYELAKAEVNKWRDLVPSLVSILKQIIEHRLPKDYDYHRIPAPWVQMNLLKILSVLGRGDQASSEGMYEVLNDVIKRADVGINVGYAVVYECVLTVTAIYPNATLLDSAATSISKFIRSDSHNLKYVGIKGLAAIVKDHPRYAVDHQMAVIDCLEDPDETLKRNTLNLLYRMTNGVNVEFIANKLLFFLESSSDDHFRTDLVEKLTLCAERYAPSNGWFVRTIIRVFELAGDKVQRNVANTLIQLLAEGSQEDDDSDSNDEDEDNEDDDVLRSDTVDDFLVLIKKPKLSETLAQTMLWVLGEYGYLSRTNSMEMIIDSLCELMTRLQDERTQACNITAIMKLVSQTGTCSAKTLLLIEQMQRCSSVDVAQRATEFLQLLKYNSIMPEVLPVDASCEDIEVDDNLPFLDNYVNQALREGARPYAAPDTLSRKGDASVLETGNDLNFTPYEMPTTPTAASLGMMAGIASNGMIPAGGTVPDLSSGNGMDSNGVDVNAPAGNNNALFTSPLGPAANGNTMNTAVFARSGGAGGGPWGRKMAPVNKTDRSELEVQNTAALPVQENLVGGNEDNGDSLLEGGNGIPDVTNTNSTVDEAVVVEAPVLPREKSEKEKMAAALFGGVAGGSNTKSNSKRRALEKISSRQQAAANKIVAPVPVVTAAVNDTDLLSDNIEIDMDDLSLLGMGDDTTSNDNGNSTVVPPLPSVLSEDADMDDLLYAAASADKAATSNNNALLDNDVVPSTTPPAAPMLSNDNAADMFAGMTPTTPTPVSPVITPLPIDTPQFGAQWGSLSSTIKKQLDIKESITSLPGLRACIEKGGCYAHVESIEATQEAIYAGQEDQHTLLVHIKLTSANVLQITVKSDGDTYSEHAYSSIAQTF